MFPGNGRKKIDREYLNKGWGGGKEEKIAKISFDCNLSEEFRYDLVNNDDFMILSAEDFPLI